MAQSFWPVTPVRIIHVHDTESMNWEDVDISAYVASGHTPTGAILHVINYISFPRNFGMRKNGSSDARTNYLLSTSHNWAMIGVDDGGIFEAYAATSVYSGYIDVWLVGYTTAGVTMLTNGVEIAPSALSTWEDEDCASTCPSAVGIILEVVSTVGSKPGAGVRKNGSTDARTNAVYPRTWMIIGCDSSQIIELYRYNAGIQFFIIGYITSGAVFLTNGVDVTPARGSFQRVDCAPYAPGAVMVIFEIHSTDSQHNEIAIRKYNSSENIDESSYSNYPWAIIEPGSDATSDVLVQMNVEDDDTYVYILGYAEQYITYPTGPATTLTRVTSLIHRYTQGVYTLQIGLGGVVSGAAGRAVPGDPTIDAEVVRLFVKSQDDVIKEIQDRVSDLEFSRSQRKYRESVLQPFNAPTITEVNLPYTRDVISPTRRLPGPPSEPFTTSQDPYR